MMIWKLLHFQYKNMFFLHRDQKEAPLPSCPLPIVSVNTYTCGTIYFIMSHRKILWLVGGGAV